MSVVPKWTNFERLSKLIEEEATHTRAWIHAYAFLMLASIAAIAGKQHPVAIGISVGGAIIAALMFILAATARSLQLSEAKSEQQITSS